MQTKYFFNSKQITTERKHMVIVIPYIECIIGCKKLVQMNGLI